MSSSAQRRISGPWLDTAHARSFAALRMTGEQGLSSTRVHYVTIIRWSDDGSWSNGLCPGSDIRACIGRRRKWIGPACLPIREGEVEGMVPGGQRRLHLEEGTCAVRT